MKVVNKSRLYIGFGIILFLLVGYLFRVEIDTGANYTVTDTLLGIIIFHSFSVFIVYLLVALFFIFTGFKRIKIA